MNTTRRGNPGSGIDTSSEQGRESLALGVGAIAFTVVGLLTLVVFRLQPLPITGSGSIGHYGAVSSALVAAAAFVAGRCVMPLPPGSRRSLNVLDVAALAFAHAVIALVTWTLTAELIDAGFIDALVFGLPSMLISGTMAAITAYAVFSSATQMNLVSLATVLAVFLVAGVVASTLTASDPHWWKEDLSALGMTDDASALAFNLTLIVGGVIVTTLARHAVRSIPTAHQHGVARLRLCMILLGILLALVGLFPADAFYGLHTGFAAAMAVVFSVMVALLPRWIPRMPRLFIALGWLFIAILVVHFILFAVGYYILTAVELVVGILVITWIILFIFNATAAKRDFRREKRTRVTHSSDRAGLGGAS